MTISRLCGRLGLGSRRVVAEIVRRMQSEASCKQSAGRERACYYVLAEYRRAFGYSGSSYPGARIEYLQEASQNRPLSCILMPQAGLIW